MHSHAGTKEACHMGVLVVAFFWIPACAGMTRVYQELWNLNSATSHRMTACFALCDALESRNPVTSHTALCDTLPFEGSSQLPTLFRIYRLIHLLI